MSYSIRKVDTDDDEIVELLKHLHDEVFASTVPQINPERGWWWLAHDGREVAGFCGLTPAWGQPRDVGYLKRAGVRLPHRGQGLQRRLVRVREAQARRVGLRSLVTDTTNNPASSNNLINCGYRIYQPSEPWGFNNTIYWYKDL